MGGMKYGEAGLDNYQAKNWSEWQKDGYTVSALLSFAAWYVADWFLQGERQFGEKAYSQVDSTGLSNERIQTLLWVASRFPKEKRQPGLSFEAHRELASIDPPEDRWRLAADYAKDKTSAKYIRIMKRNVRKGRNEWP